MTETKTLFNGRWLKLMARGSWEYAERVNPKGAVIILAITDADEILFVEQYRVPIQSLTIELPAGLIGDEAGTEGEGAIETARRELEEETGYRPTNVEFVMQGPSSAGMSTEMCAFVRATGLVRVGPGGGHPGEDITVHHVPRAGCAAFMARKMAEGYAIDPKMYAGVYFLERNPRGELWK